MTDPNQTGTQEGAPASASTENASTTEQANQPQPLTTEQMEAVQKIVAEQATRIAQSMVDKAENRISKKAQEQIEALKVTQQALGLSDEQVEQAANKIVLEDLKTVRGQASQQASTQQTATEQIHPVIAQTLKAFEIEGVTIEPTDPEYKPLDAILKDVNANEYVYFKELKTQIEAKRQRTAANQQAAPARVVSGGQSQTTDAPPQATARGYLERAHKK